MLKCGGVPELLDLVLLTADLAELTADATTFHIREKLTAKRGEAVVFEREHRNAIPRDLM